MSFEFVEKVMCIGGEGNPSLQFYKRGFNLGGSGASPSWQDVILSGNTALTLVNSKADGLNYVKLFGKCEQRNLPSGYTQAEYLSKSYNGNTFDAVCYNTGFVPQGNEVIELDFMILNTVSPSTYCPLFGQRTAAVVTAADNYWLGINSSLQLFSRFGTVNLTTSPTLSLNTKYHCVIDLVNCILTLNGTDYTFAGSTIEGITRPIYLFNMNDNSPGGISVSGSVRIYDFKIKRNGQSVYTAIPMTNVGIYDSISGVANTTINGTYGTITAGANAVPTPDTPMDIYCNNGALKFRNKSGLPSGYQAVEYLESSGEEYIDLGDVLNTSTDDIEIEIQLIQAESVTNIFGARNSTTARVYTLASNGEYWRWGWKNNSTASDVTVDLNKHVLRIDHTNNTLSLDGTVIETKGSAVSNITTPTTPTLFAIHATSGTDYYYGALKVFGLKKWTNGVLAQNLIPCRRNSDNVLGMYDLVNNTFLTNAGTGTFVAGADVPNYEIYTDGTTETVEIDTTGDTATAENLFKVGTYQDVQSVIDGEVTKNVGIKVLDGTEDWREQGGTRTWGYCYSLENPLQNAMTGIGANCYSTHFKAVARCWDTAIEPCFSFHQLEISTWTGKPFFVVEQDTAQKFNQWLADQYNAGTPVIIVYPLATATTETVTAQPLSIQAGTNTVEITQASIDNLELEVSYKATT